MLALSFVLIPTTQVNAMTVEDLFVNFTSDSYILMDSTSQTILYGKNAEQKMPAGEDAGLFRCRYSVPTDAEIRPVRTENSSCS